MFINNYNNKKDIVIIPKKYNNENLNIKSLNKIDIKHDKSYENIKNIVLEKSKK